MDGEQITACHKGIEPKSEFIEQFELQWCLSRLEIALLIAFARFDIGRNGFTPLDEEYLPVYLESAQLLHALPSFILIEEATASLAQRGLIRICDQISHDKVAEKLACILPEFCFALAPQVGAYIPSESGLDIVRSFQLHETNSEISFADKDGGICITKSAQGFVDEGSGSLLLGYNSESIGTRPVGPVAFEWWDIQPGVLLSVRPTIDLP